MSSPSESMSPVPYTTRLVLFIIVTVHLVAHFVPQAILFNTGICLNCCHHAEEFDTYWQSIPTLDCLWDCSNGPCWAGIVTHAYFHTGLIHLAMNSMFTYHVGKSLEGKFGTLQFLGIIAVLNVVTGVFYMVISFVIGLAFPSFWSHSAIGFSGVAFAFLAIESKFHEPNAPRSVSLMVTSFTVPNRLYPWAVVVAWQLVTQVVFGIGVSFEGHLAGVVAGWLYASGCLHWMLPSLDRIRAFESLELMERVVQKAAYKQCPVEDVFPPKPILRTLTASARRIFPCWREQEHGTSREAHEDFDDLDVHTRNPHEQQEGTLVSRISNMFRGGRQTTAYSEVPSVEPHADFDIDQDVEVAVEMSMPPEERAAERTPVDSTEPSGLGDDYVVPGSDVDLDFGIAVPPSSSHEQPEHSLFAIELSAPSGLGEDYVVSTPDRENDLLSEYEIDDGTCTSAHLISSAPRCSGADKVSSIDESR